METDEYQGFQIEHEPDLRLPTTSVRDHWFNVDSQGKPVFRVRMRVRLDYAVRTGAPGHPVDAAVDLARDLGLRWTHGLIDLGRFEEGALYEEERTESWDPLFGQTRESDEDLRLHVLGALRRLLGAEQLMSSIPSLDVEGLADVLGVAAARTRSTIVELKLEGLIEGSAETFGHTAEDGACRITGRGLEVLRAATSTAERVPQTPAPRSRDNREFGGRWRVERSLGEGGQAHTFIVRDTTSESTDWVLKRLKNRRRLGRFKQEIEALQRLDSRRIPRVVDFSVDDPAYIVTPFLGESLTKAEGLREMQPAERLVFFEGVVEGIRDAHSAGITHRDVKPDNVVVGADGAFVIDFGICQLVDGTLMLTTVDEAFGNAAFAAPECGRGSQVDCGPPSDVYSLGKLLFWLMTDGEFIVRERFDEASEGRIQVDDPWVRRYVSLLIRGCVTEDPAQRWSADYLFAMLQEVRRLIQARQEASRADRDIVWNAFWLNDEFNPGGSRSATQPGRGNPPADGEVSSSFTVPDGFDVEFEELLLAVAHRAGGEQLEVHVLDDVNGAPSGADAVETLLTAVEPQAGTHVLQLQSVARPLFRAGRRYWVAVSVPEPDTEIAWFAAAPQLSELRTRIAERFDNGDWRVGDTRGGMAFRVTGVKRIGI